MKKKLKLVARQFLNFFDFILQCCQISCKKRLYLMEEIKKIGFFLPYNVIIRVTRLWWKPERKCNCKEILGRTFQKGEKKRLLIDVSVIAHVNARSGIQRVVISLLNEFIENDCFVNIPVGRIGGQMHRIEYHKDDCSFHVCEKLKVKNKDILLMLDSSWNDYESFIPFFNKIRRVEGEIYQIVYDLIPIHYPQYSTAYMVSIFDDMLKSAIRNVDGVLCISQTVAGEIFDYVRDLGLKQRVTPLKIGSFLLGADFTETENSVIDPNVLSICSDVKNKTKFLSVSTIEPRKNYDFMLNVMEKLWARGYDIVYWIVGKHGWSVDDLVSRIKKHPELGKRLFWFPELDDSSLKELYKETDILLNLSHAEGYGLSLIEGAYYQCSIVASDIPIFREVMKADNVLFCNIKSLEETVESIAIQLDKKSFPCPCGKYRTWQESLNSLLDVVTEQRWDYEII